MAKFPSLTFTTAGTQMLVQAQNGHTLTFTSGKLGSGVLDDSDDISKFTDLKSAKMTLPITSVDDSNAEKIVLTFDASNTSLEEGFVSRELGIFAKLDSGTETLYAYSNAGNNYDYIPSKDTPTDENRLVVSIVVSSSATINVAVDGSIVYVHKSDVESMIAEHNSATDAHSALTATIDDTLTPTADENTLRNLLSNLAYEIKANKGTSGWKDAPGTTLAALATLVSNLSSGSDVVWDGKKFTNAKLGISGLMDTNGYVSFGPNAGGLIIQWGKENSSATSGTITLPIVPKTIFALTIFDNGQLSSSLDTSTVKGHWTSDYSGITWYAFYTNTGVSVAPSTFNWMCICLAS